MKRPTCYRMVVLTSSGPRHEWLLSGTRYRMVVLTSLDRSYCNSPAQTASAYEGFPCLQSVLLADNLTLSLLTKT